MRPAGERGVVSNGQQPPSRLARRLGTFDAVILGFGSMMGAGVFVVFAPAAAAAGSGLLIGLLVASVVALCNATSSAQLAAIYPQSGGTYVYGRERLGSFWGYLAGWGFVAGKTASCAAMGYTFGVYAAPEWRRQLAVAAVIAVTIVSYRGVDKTVRMTYVVVAVVLGVLGVVIATGLVGGTARVNRIGPLAAGGLGGILEAAGLIFFAFAGYARIATLGEEVIDPERTIPRAITIALGVTVIVYAAVAFVALTALGPDRLSDATAPLADVVAAGPLEGWVPMVRVGGAVASLGVLLSLAVGVSRTVFAMATGGDLPAWLGAIHPRHRVPHRAQLLVGGLVTAVVLFADLRGVIGFSSVTILAYYAIANAAALTLPLADRRWPRGLAVLGVVGCVILALTLSPRSVIAGLAVLALGSVLWWVRASPR